MQGVVVLEVGGRHGMIDDRKDEAMHDGGASLCDEMFGGVVPCAEGMRSGVRDDATI